MMPRRFQYRLCALLAFAVMGAPSFVARGEPLPPVSPPPAVQIAPPPRPKPQIIYHLPRNSSSAAALHSQAKNQSHLLPIDSNMPPSLQLARAAANEAAAREQQQQQQQQQQTAPKANSPRQSRINSQKTQSKQPQIRKHGPGKLPAPGSSRSKGRKK